MSMTGKKKKSGVYYSGISGLVLPMPKYKFPAEFQTSTRLTYYASLLNSIEINKSFYELPKSKTMAKWASEVPETFRFTFKLWKEITHAKGMNFKEHDVKEFLSSVNHVGQKKGALLIQFPASLEAHNIDQLGNLLNVIKSLKESIGWKISLEFRNGSWYNEDTHALAREMGATIVFHDKARAASKHTEVDSDFVYLRFHGPEGNYRGTYTEDVLYEYAGYVKSWMNQGKDVYVYFNNTMGNAFENLMALNKFVSKN